MKKNDSLTQRISESPLTKQSANGPDTSTTQSKTLKRCFCMERESECGIAHLDGCQNTSSSLTFSFQTTLGSTSATLRSLSAVSVWPHTNSTRRLRIVRRQKQWAGMSMRLLMLSDSTAHLQTTARPARISSALSAKRDSTGHCRWTRRLIFSRFIGGSSTERSVRRLSFKTTNQSLTTSTPM